MSGQDDVIPVFVGRQLSNLRHFVSKSAAHFDAVGVTDASVLESRLAPDMYPFSSQIEIATDLGVSACALLGAIEHAELQSVGTTLSGCIARISSAVAVVSAAEPQKLAGWERREVRLVVPTGGELHYSGHSYFHEFLAPNLLFHISIAYGLLRSLGAPIGKLDFHGVGAAA